MNRTQVEYELLAIFVQVAEALSFSRAAQKLGISKGTVSRSIARLEEQLGCELLHRTTHTVVLSTAGTELYERIAQHLAALDQALLELPERAAQPSGELRLTAPHDFAITLLPDILTQFAMRYPEVRFDVRVSNQVLDLVRESFDLAIRVAVGNLEDSSLTARRLGIGRGAFYAAPTYIARRGKPRKLGEPRHEWVLHPAAVAIWKLPRESFRFVLDDFLLIRDVIGDGAGIGLLPRFVAEPYAREGLLEAVDLDERPLDGASYFMVYPSSGQVPKKVTAFRDFLLDWMKRNPLD